MHSPSSSAGRAGRRRSNVALAVALVALLAATTGTAYAASVARNSVVSSSIKNGEVKSRDLAEGAVNSSRLRDNSVRSTDITDGTITTFDLDQGAVGGNDLANISVVEATSPQIQDADGTSNGGVHGLADLTATCPTGTRIIGGGATWTGASNDNNYDRNVYIQASHMEGNGWSARGIVDFGASGYIRLRVEAYCLVGGIPILTAQ